MHLHIFTTGGTIDKVYFDARSEFEVGDPQITEILQRAGASFEWTVQTLMRKDSLDLTDDDRAVVAERVRAVPGRHVVVTHGTDTMAATAEALGDVGDKTVVFVGSLSPARFRETDAEFNIGFAVAAVQALPPGVYIAMNGRIFPRGHVHKNRSANRFEGEAFVFSDSG